jgi:hypothetical protein
VRIDTEAPVIHITSPVEGATYLLNATAHAAFECVDQTGLSGVVTCTGSIQDGGLLETTTVGAKVLTVTAVDRAGNVSTRTTGYSVQYGFAGFFAPVENLPVVNRVRAGAAVPIKFSLQGDQGLDIFEAGYPLVQPVACSDFAPMADIEETIFAGSNSLQYDAATDRYTFVWKTDRAWSGGCARLLVRLRDGITRSATFSFAK